MRNISIALLLLLGLTNSTHAQVYVLNNPYYYPAPVYVPQPVIVVPPVVQVAPVVAVPVAPVCTTYPDPWDTLGYIFGDPIMIQVCR